jgi:hypothetical protein
LAQSIVAEGGGQIQLADDEDGVLLLGASLRF